MESESDKSYKLSNFFEFLHNDASLWAWHYWKIEHFTLKLEMMRDRKNFKNFCLNSLHKIHNSLFIEDISWKFDLKLNTNKSGLNLCISRVTKSDSPIYACFSRIFILGSNGEVLNEKFDLESDEFNYNTSIAYENFLTIDDFTEHKDRYLLGGNAINICLGFRIHATNLESNKYFTIEKDTDKIIKKSNTYSSLYKSNTFSDMYLQFEDATISHIPAHSLILKVHSETLSSMIDLVFQSSSNILKLNVKFEHFEPILKYFYTVEWPTISASVNWTHLEEMMRITELLKLDKLKLHLMSCALQLKYDRMDNIGHLLKILLSFNPDDKIKILLKRIYSENRETLFKMASFLHLYNENVDIFNELLEN